MTTTATEVGFLAARQAFLAWLGSGAYWQSPPAGTLPVMLVQPVNAGTERKYIGGVVIWRGDVVVRCHAADPNAAAALARTARDRVPETAQITYEGATWDIKTTPLPPPPPAQFAQQAAANLSYRVELTRRVA